jgi:hypothetical protein
MQQERVRFVLSHHPLLLHLVIHWIKSGSRTKFFTKFSKWLARLSIAIHSLSTTPILSLNPDDSESTRINFPLEDAHLAVCPNFFGGSWKLETLRRSQITEQEAINELADA